MLAKDASVTLIWTLYEPEFSAETGQHMDEPGRRQMESFKDSSQACCPSLNLIKKHLEEKRECFYLCRTCASSFMGLHSSSCVK